MYDIKLDLFFLVVSRSVGRLVGRTLCYTCIHIPRFWLFQKSRPLKMNQLMQCYIKAHTLSKIVSENRTNQIWWSTLIPMLDDIIWYNLLHSVHSIHPLLMMCDCCLLFLMIWLLSFLLHFIGHHTTTDLLHNEIFPVDEGVLHRF